MFDKNEFIRAIALVAVIIIPAACASWSKPGASEYDFESDKAECASRADAATADVNRNIAIYHNCLRGKGWRQG